ncbi:hypothetical protein CAP36_00570 [Chitinophagaceae bacterium IBVUCB2]|nr:hypothetical protein CAP36_00570 [Chitinophagaceae bacterium IBVUCB2]
MKIRFLLAVITSLLFFSACERVVEFELNDVSPKLVVEGTIENNEAPVIYLSKSQAYFSSIDLNTLANSFVRNAEVYVSNGITTHKLKEYTVPLGPGINFYYYSNDPASPATAFFGEINKQYSLRIVAEGKEYTATTWITDTTRRIDSLYWKPAPAGNPAEKVAVMIKATDKPGFGDYVRYFTKRNSEIFYPGFNSVYDDQVIDGSTYNVQVERGIPRTGSTPEGYSFFDKGDTVTLKLSNIDKATYDFWRTMEFTYASVGNPFSSPTKVISNINGGGLGYFGGYATQYRTIVIPR